MNHYDFKGRTAVITGGAQGIGYACAERLLAGGARVVLWDRDPEVLQAARASLTGGEVLGFLVDIGDAAHVDATAAATTRALGAAVDILINSAGITGPTVPLASYPPEDWARVMQINLNGTFHVNRALVAGMIERGYGRIVNVASIAGKEGNPNASAYSASKAGVIALTKSLGKETAGHDIAVNAITPAAAKTKIFEQMPQQHIDFMLSKIPRGRFVTVQEIAAMVAWLVSAENSFTTGAVFDLSGGRATY